MVYKKHYIPGGVLLCGGNAMTSSTCAKVLAGLLLYSIALLPCDGVRNDGMTENKNKSGNDLDLDLEGQAHYNIDLVVTRHALSCANIIADFDSAKSLPTYQKLSQKGGYRKIADPILAEAGVKSSLDMRNITTDFKPDAVLTSPLLRAIQTAILQYPSDTLHIVPWIREVSALAKGPLSVFAKLGVGGEGADNLPTPFVDQKKRLKNELNTIQGLLGVRSIEKIQFIDWTTTETRVANHDWKLFKEFLAKEFLPFLIPKLNRPLGSTITLAVVTHSNFMKSEDDIKSNCGGFWAANGKPWNNQAVNISYDASSQITIKSPSLSHEVQTEPAALQETFVLTQKNGCNAVAGGVPYKSRKLCLQDIGESCQKNIKDQGLFLPELLETTIKALQDKKEKKEKELRPMLEELPDKANQEEYFQDHVKPLQAEVQALGSEIRALQNTKCIANSFPNA